MTEPTAVPTPPAWLNLSVIIDEETMGRIAVMTAEIERLGPEVIPAIQRARALLDAVEKASQSLEAPEGAEDGIWESVWTYSGCERLQKALIHIGGNFMGFA